MGKATQEYNLEVIHPKVSKEWHKTKNNPLTPKEVTPGSKKKVWWQCKKSHEWNASIGHRSRGSGCPECAGQKVGEDNNLFVKFQKVAKEWHPTKNKPLTSKEVTPGSKKKVWWQCKKSHEWEAMVGSRSKGNGCPECAGKKVGKDNNLFVKLPKVSKEWHTTKNKPLTPKDVTPGSKKKVWWQCKKSHEWKAPVKERLRGRNCPICKPNISKIQIQIFCELKIVFEDILLGKKIDGIECDIYLPSFKIAVEYDGYRWHKGNKKRDEKKNAELKKKGVTLLRIREPKLEKISHNDVLIKSGESTISVVKRLLIKLFKKHSFSSTQKDQFNKYNVATKLRNIKEYNKLVSYLPGCLPENSLKFNFPKIAKQWNFERNEPLQPEWFSKTSMSKVWWKCDKGHEWEATIANRSSRKSGCPECAGKKVGKDNNLFVKLPKVSKEWHKTKNNPLTPKDVTPGSGKKVWWQCNKGHEWNALITDRSRGSGCPVCSGHRVGKDNNLFIKHPKLAKEWHTTKNKPLTPKDVTPGSKKKVWWQCKKSHKWEALIKDRSRGSGCPKCWNDRSKSGNN